MATKNQTLTFRIDPALRRRLERLALATRRSMSYLTAEALDAYLQRQEWEIDDIKRALTEAERGDFASQAEVKAMFRKYSRHARKVAS